MPNYEMPDYAGNSLPIRFKRGRAKAPVDMTTSPSTGNYILDRLSESEKNRFSPHLRSIPLVLGSTFSDRGITSDKIYFPTSAILALMMTTEDGETAEVGIVGREGAIDTSLYLSGGVSNCQATVIVKGRALSLPADIARQEFEMAGNFKHLLLNYSQALINEIKFLAICYRHHKIEQQFACWLLLMADRLDSSTVTMTQQTIAEMLGVRREGVTAAAIKLRESGLISYRRGAIDILDKQGLTDTSCECYKHHHQNFLSLCA